MSLLLVRGARQLLTLTGASGPRRGTAMRELNVVQNGAVLIRNGLIEEAGPASRIENLAAARDAREINVAGRLVMPGFVDSHTHLVFGPPRLDDYEMRLAGASYQEIAEAGGGILSSVRAVRNTPFRHLLDRARQRVANFLRHGTTTLEAKSGYGLDESGERKLLRCASALDEKPAGIVSTYLGAHVVPPEHQADPGAYLEWMCSQMLPRIRQRKLASFVDVYCERGAFTLEQSRRYLQAAKRQRFGLKVHAEQFSNTGATRLAVELGAASADHLDCITGDDAAALAASDTVATLLPGAVFHLGLDRYPPARTLIDKGAIVALATDFNPGTCPTCGMPMILSLACARMGMSPAEAIVAATVNAAHAIGREAVCGSFHKHKHADLIALDATDYREIPYHFGVNLVALTMKCGRVVYQAGKIAQETTCREDS